MKINYEIYGKGELKKRMYKTVEFLSENAILRGRLYACGSIEKSPIIIMAHGYSATITLNEYYNDKRFKPFKDYIHNC